MKTSPKYLRTEFLMSFTGASQMQSAAMSLIVLCWSYSEFSRARRSSSSTKKKLNLFGMIIQFLWRLCTVVPRVLSFALFATVYGAYMLIIVGIHWMFMSAWVRHQRTHIFSESTPRSTPIRDFVFNSVVGYMFIFCFFNISGQATRRKYVVYYSLVFVENLSMLLSWYFNVSHTTYALPTILSLSGVFLLGLMFMLFYYLAVHPQPNLPNRSQRATFI